MRTAIDQDAIDCLVRHCRMYLYGTSGSPEIRVNEVASDFFSFALLHLTATMFITTDHREGPEGVFHRLLDPAGLSNWVRPIDRVLASPLGRTNLKAFIRVKRNKMATHGALAWRDQPAEVQAVTFDERALNEYRELMEQLDEEVRVLHGKLDRLTKTSRPIASRVLSARSRPRATEG